MAETLAQLTAYINELLPNRVNSTTLVTLINNEMLKIFRDMTSTAYAQLTTLSSETFYSLPTDCDFEMINENGLNIATSANSTIFNTYSYAGPDEELTYNHFFEGPNNTFGLYPTPLVTGLSMIMKYQKRPALFGSASSDSTSLVELDQDYTDLLKFRVMERVAKSGNSPDVELANNYAVDAMELRRELKFKRANERMKNPRKRFSYKDW